MYFSTFFNCKKLRFLLLIRSLGLLQLWSQLSDMNHGPRERKDQSQNRSISLLNMAHSLSCMQTLPEVWCFVGPCTSNFNPQKCIMYIIWTNTFFKLNYKFFLSLSNPLPFMCIGELEWGYSETDWKPHVKMSLTCCCDHSFHHRAIILFWKCSYTCFLSHRPFLSCSGQIWPIYKLKHIKQQQTQLAAWTDREIPVA